MKRVIVTGGTGFVGANLVRRLLQDGHTVHLLVRKAHNRWRIAEIQDDLRIYQVELDDAEALAGIVGAIRPDWIFHLAVHGAYSSQIHVSQMIQTNIIGTINLVEACLKIGFEAFVNTGSSSEYGFKTHAPAEIEWLEPNSYYAVTKASATLFCRFIAQSKQVHLPTLRLYSVFGPFEEPSRLLPTLIVRGLQGQLPPLVHPTIARDYVYTDDVSQAYILAATRPGQEPGAVYNVGTGNQTTLREVVEIARQELQITAEPQWESMPDRQWDSSIWVSNSRKIQHELNWQPRTTIAQGFSNMVHWLRDNPAIRRFYEECLLKAKY
jgi:UDP-glucose 4-epimerase